MTFLQSLRRSSYIPVIPLVTMVWSFLALPKSAHADDAPSSGEGSTGGFDTSIAASAAGASKGTGSALNVDTATGAMQTSIPFESPKARGAVQPNLGLSYSSAAGTSNGVGGMGWGLTGVGAIERHPRSGMPKYKDPANGALLDPAVADQFVFNGRALAAMGLVGAVQEEGIPSFATGGGWTYFRLVNDDFTRFFWSPDHRTWIVQFKTGETWELGVPLSVTYANAADQTAALDVDRQVEPGKAVAPPFRWNLAVRYDPQGGVGHALNRIVYRWSHLDSASTLADLGYLVDVYDTPNVSAANTLSADPAIFAHHTHLSYIQAHVLFTAVTPVWRAAPLQNIDHVDVTTAEDGRATRSLLHRYTLNYVADIKNGHIQHLASVSIEGRCPAPLLEQNALVPTTTRCTTQAIVPTFTYTSQTPFVANTTASQVATSTAIMPVKGAIPDPAFAPLNPYLYDVNGDGIADIVYGDNDGGTLKNIQRQWISTNGQTFEAVDNLPNPYGSFGFVPFHPGDYTGTQQLSVMVPESAGFPPIDPLNPRAYPVVAPTYQTGTKTWRWTQQSVTTPPLDARVTTANPNGTAPYSDGHPPRDGIMTRGEQTLAIEDFDGDGYPDQLTETAIDQYGWVYSAWPNGNLYYAQGFHRRLGAFLALRSTQKDAAGQVLVFNDYAPGRGVDHTIHAPASNIDVPPAPLTGTQYVGRLDAPNMFPFDVDPFWSINDKKNWTPPAEAPLDASLMYRAPFFADMNGDGLPDWVVIPPSKSKSRHLWYWAGHGDGTFGECGPVANCPTTYNSSSNGVVIDLPDVSDPYPTTDPLGIPPAWPADPERIVRDVTGDGLADLIVLEPSGINVFRNVNGRQFQKVSHTDKSLLGSYDIIPRSCPNHSCAYFGNYHPRTHLMFADPYGSGHESMVLMTVVNDGTNVSNSYRIETSEIDIIGSQPVGLMETERNGAGLTTTVSYETTTHQAQSANLATSLTGPWTRTMPIVKNVVSHIETTNNMTGLLEERHASDLAYKDPVYDGHDHVFRGFQKAVRFDRDDANRNGVITANSYLTGLCEADHWTQSCLLQSATERPIDALRGLPWMTEVYALDGTYKSTVVNHYEVRTTRQQFVDKRHAHYVVPLQKDTYLYDGTVSKSTMSVVFPVATILDPSSSTKNESDQWVTIHGSERAPAVARLTVRSEFDTQGNLTDIWNDGVVGRDDSIHTKLLWTRLGTDWTWRLTHRHVDALPAAATNGTLPDRDLDVTYDYDNFGNPKGGHSPLVGSSPVTRFHETGLEVADSPLGASVDGHELFAEVASYDAYGNLTQKSKGSGKECVSVLYDDAFKLFPKSETAYSLPSCKGISFTTSMKYDWGASQPVLIVSVSGATTTKTYDDFGRLWTVVKPDPNTGAPMKAAALRLSYFDTKDSSVHAVQVTSTDTVTGATSNAWTYTEPFGHELATIRPTDVATDAKAWIVEGAALRDLNGRKVASFDPYFWAGTPSATSGYPFSAASGYAGSAPAAKRTVFDAFGRPTSTLGRDGLQDARWAYHALSVDTFDAEQLRGKHQGAFVTTAKDGHGRTASVTERVHDATGALQSVVTTTLYTARGMPRSMAKAGMPPHIFGYDSVGRLVWNLEPNTTRDTTNHRPSWSYYYDDDGNLVGTTDARGCGENLYYDTNGRILAEDYSPCLASQLPHSKPNLTTGDGTEAFYQYDSPVVGQVTAGMAVAWLGKVAQISDRASRTRFAYDMRGHASRVERQVAAPGAPALSLAARYAPTWTVKALTFDDRDRPKTESTGAIALAPPGGGGSVTTLNYSSRGTPSSVTSTYSATPLVKSHKFDADNFLRVVTYGDLAATTVTATPDAVLRTLAGVDVTRTAPSTWSGAVSLPYTSPAASSTTQTTLASVSLTPDLIGNPVTIADKRNAGAWPDGAKPVNKTLTYDDLYRLTSVTSVYNAAYKGKQGTDKQESPFAAEIARGDGSDASYLKPQQQPLRQTSESYAYDLVGNVTKSGDDANAFFDRSLGTITNGAPSSTWGPNQLTHAQGASGDQQLDATYDVAGNLQLLTVAQACADYNGTCQHRFEYAWNEVGQLERAKRWDLPSMTPGIIPTPVDPKNPPGIAANADLAFAYDASGSRVLKSSYDAGTLSGTNVTIFPSLHLEHAAWKSGDYERTTDTEAVYLTVGGKSFGRVVYSKVDPILNQSGSLHVFLEIGDHLGSTSIVIDQATGELVERATYSAYGSTDSDYRPARWDSFREAYRFTGQEDDAEVGLTYFGARYYAPQLGRFISADPLAVHTTQGDPNPYAYVRGHASNATDPNGLDCGVTAEICIGPPTGGPDMSYGPPGGFTIPTVTVVGDAAAGAIANYMATQGATPDPDFSGLGGIEDVIGEGAGEGAGAIWESKPMALERWNPNATSSTEAMLLGSATEMSWAKLNPEAYSIGMTVIAWTPPAAVVTSLAKSMDPTLSPGARVFHGIVAAASILPVGRIASRAAAAGFEIYYGISGVEATITADMIGTGTRAASRLRPPGFLGQAAGHARGHLLGRNLGGSGTEIKNLVTLFQNPTNTPVMSGIERTIANAVKSGETVNFGAMPIYLAGREIPAGVTIVAEGSNGFSLAVTVLNR